MKKRALSFFLAFAVAISTLSHITIIQSAALLAVSATLSSSGTSHTIEVKPNGTVQSWGTNSNGQLGNGTTTDSAARVQVSGLTNITSVASGTLHNLALKSDGTVWTWGYNNYGQLGDGTSVSKSTPVQISGLSDVASIAAGSSTGYAIKSDGTVWAWGYNNYGQLGDGTTTNRNAPVQVTGLTNIVKVSTSGSHALFLRSDGAVYVVGHNNNGQLGIGSTTNKSLALEIASFTATDIVASQSGTHSMALKSDGTVWTWGYNASGQLGIASTTDKTAPVKISSLSSVSKIAAYGSSSYAIKTDGTAWAWGANGSGQLGDGTTTTRSAPVQITGISGVTDISNGSAFVIAFKSDGSIWGWGLNGSKQLAGVTGNQTSPVELFEADASYIPASLEFSESAYSATVPDSSQITINITANAYNADAEAISNAQITYSLSQTYTGVSINASTGVVTVASTASAGTVTVVARCGQLSETVNLVLTITVQVLEIISFAVSLYSIAIPESGSSTVTVHADLFDEDGEIIYADPVYSLMRPYAGVSINSGTGAVTVTGSAQPGAVVIIAEYGDLKDSAGLLLTDDYTEPESSGGISFIYSIEIPSDGENSLSVQAEAFDENYAPVSDVSIVYSLSASQTGVSINSGTGLVTVSDEAQPGRVNIQATDGTRTSSAILLLESGDGDVNEGQEPESQANIEFEQSQYSLQVLVNSTVQTTVAATVTDDNGSDVTDANIVYSLASAYTGVSIESGSGVITVGSTAQAGEVTVIASYEALTGQAVLTLEKSAHIEFLEPEYTIDIPSSGANTVELTACLYDDDNILIEDDVELTYTLELEYAGISVDSETGVVTATSAAQEGAVTVVAQYDDLSAAVVITVQIPEPEPFQLSLDIVPNKTYFVAMSAQHVHSFADKIFTLNYDTSKLQMLDLAAQTFAPNTQAGVIPGTGIEILSVGGGAVTFSMTKEIPDDKVWSGVVTLFRFKSLASGTSQVTIV
jgi:alpha-tubulin suppressor-like RCC1 family protein